MTIPMLIAWFAKEYSWSLDDILNLTKRQVGVLLDASIKLSKTLKSSSEKNPTKVGKGKMEVNDPLALLGMSGVKLTPRAKKALMKHAGIKKDVKH